MMKSKNLFRKRLAFVLLTGIMTVLALSFLTTLLERKNSKEKYADFFSQEEDFDVLFFGTSHVINGIAPMELWGDYGIVSYNFGGHANKIPVSYWAMINALDYTTPRLVVIDCLKLDENIKTNENLNYLHNSFDAFPLSQHKVQAIHDLLDDPYMPQHLESVEGEYSLEERTPMQFLWDFSIYHSRWEKWNEKDSVFDERYEKGAESRIGVAKPDAVERTDAVFEGETVAIDYLERMIRECKTRDIDVLLVFLPYPADQEDHACANRMEELADAHHVRSLNLLDDCPVDYNTDMYDAYSHMNPSGAKKVSAYLGEYIMDHYDIPDRRKDATYTDWNRDYEEYRDYKEELLHKQKELDDYLMLAADEDYEIQALVRDPIIYSSEKYADLLDNLDVMAIEETDGDVFLTETPEEHAGNIETIEGLEGEKDALKDMDLSVVITDAESGEMIDEVGFNYSLSEEDSGEVDTEEIVR